MVYLNFEENGTFFARWFMILLFLIICPGRNNVMKKQIIYISKKVIPFFLFLFFLYSGNLTGQTKIMPLGNSITWGKSNLQPPASGTHGYRKYLYDILPADYNVEFVGPYTPWYDSTNTQHYFPDGPYYGYYIDGAQVDNFLPGGVYDVTTQLNALPIEKLPDVVLLHIGTNDIGTEQSVGNYDEPGTILSELDSLLHILLNYNRGGHTIDHIFLCKIIPVSPTDEFPGINAKILDYNSRMNLLLESLNSVDRDRVTLVNMNAPFYNNQNNYYYTAGGDHYHPSQQGYQAMANIFADYLKDYLSHAVVDEFARSSGALNGSHGWHATNTIGICNVGENGGGAIYSNASGEDWDNIAIWDSTRGMNSVTIRFHSNSSSNILIGMDTTIVDPADPNAANGYMIFVRNNIVHLKRITSCILPYEDVDYRSFPNCSPGDYLKVTYVITDTRNLFYISRNEGSEYILEDNTTDPTFKKKNSYAGLIFRDGSGSPPAAACLIDYFKAESKLRDIIAPAPITDLEVITESNTTITLQWTAVGGDGLEGRATIYDLRYSTSPITPGNFEDANIVPNVPVPGNSGEIERATVKGLLSGSRYYFAIRAIDLWGNAGEVVHLASGTTKSTGQITDNFNRTTLGNDWVYDPTEYGINTATHEMTNNMTGETWGSMVIYKGRSNPTTVKMVWGQTKNPSSSTEVENGGLVLLADDTTTTANGYFLFIRTVFHKIYLFDIEDGNVNTLLDAAPYDLDNPGKGDTLSVIVDWSNETYNRFDVYINRQPASRFALYDNNKLHGNVDKNYAGIILARTTRNNNVAAFITSGEKTSASLITALSAQTFQDTVNTQLEDSLKVEVRDQNNVPLSGIPVFFYVTQGEGSLNVPQPSDSNIFIETEWWSDLEIPMIQIDDPTASGGSYIVSTEEGPAKGYASYRFYVERSGTYYFWGRTKWDGSYKHWDLRFELVGVNPPTGFTWHVQQTEGNTGDWTWGKIRNADNGNIWFTANLTQGLHTIKIWTQHKYVPLDEILLTLNSDPGLNPDNLGPTGAVFTNGSGQATVAWTLGKTADDLSTPSVNEGLNTIVARPFGTDASVTFQATGIPAPPDSMHPSNLSQSGAAGTSVPIAVTLYDPYDNKVPNFPVIFEIIKGTDGGLTAPAVPIDTVLTDNSGHASTSLVLGYQDTLYQARATFAGYTGPEIVFSATVIEGTIKKVTSLTRTDEKHYVNQVLPNFLKVQVFDTQNKPVAGTPITFMVKEGDASVGVQPKWTDSNGIAQDTLWTGKMPGIVKAVAHTSLADYPVVTDSIFYRGAHLTYLSGEGYVLSPGATTPGPQRVILLDKDGHRVEGEPITFTIAHLSSGFRFPGGSAIFVDTTNSDGIASAHVVAGTVHGKYENILQAWATDGFHTIPESPVGFDFFVKSEASHLVKLEGDSLQGVVGSLVGPLKVQMVNYNYTKHISGQPVVFKRIKGDGYFEGTSYSTVFTDTTDNDGCALAYYRLGSKAGFYNNEIVAYTINVTDSISVVFHLSAKFSDAEAMEAVSDTVFVNVVAKPQTVQVKVVDRVGNPVPGQEVHFSVISGGGILGGSPDTTKTVTTDSVSGIASVVWTLGTKAGSLNNILEATAGNGLHLLKGAPLRFYASALPDSVSSTRSTVEATGPIQATGKDTSFVTVTLVDGYGNPVSGKRVTLNVIENTLTWWYDPRDTTDASGKAYGGFVTYQAGEKKVQAKVVDDNLLLKNEATVKVYATEAAKIQKAETNSGDGQIGNVGTVLKNPFVVKVTDKWGNAVVAYKPVTFQVDEGNGKIIEPQPVMSDSNGYARAHLLLDSQPGQNRVKVTADGLEGGPVYFTATGKIGTPVSMLRVSPQSQEGTAGEPLPEPLTVSVQDADGNPVAGVKVDFAVEGGGSVDPHSSYTNEYGHAFTSFTADTISGSTTLIKATSTSFGSSVTFLVTSVPGSARRLEYVSGDGQSGYVGENTPIQIVVKTTDRFGNPVGGESVEFAVVSGDATINGAKSATVKSNAFGLASTLVVLGQTAGPIKVEARNQFLEGSPIEFTLHAEAVLAAGIKKLEGWYSGDNQKGTAGKPFVDPLRVMVIDDYGNPVSGKPVRFVVTSGGGDRGSILEPQPVISDTNGIALVHFIAGYSVGQTIVSAFGPNNSQVDFMLETVINPHSPVLNKSLIDASYDVFEKQAPPLSIVLAAEDDDVGDTLTFQAYQIGTLSLPRGATIQKSTSNTGIFQWSPDYDQAGTYHVVLRVIDGKGELDADTVKINVLNVNRMPRITAVIPKGDTSVVAGQTITFRVWAEDPDKDQLHYTWKVDGRTVKEDGPVFYHTIDKHFSGNQSVDVFVNDGIVSISFRWILDVMASVELSEFTAQFDKKEMLIKVLWSTSSENGNVGFDVYRSRSIDGKYVKINEELIPTQREGKYSFVDRSVQAGCVYYYKLVAVDASGNQMEYGPILVKIPLPQKFSLSQNYPNPFNPTTIVRYQIPKREKVELVIYNVLGQPIATLVDREQEPGYYEVKWDGKDRFGNEVSTGIYIYRLQCGEHTLTRKMIKLK